jgi:hypothetical protein
MIVIVSQLLIYQRVRLCANLLWSDLVHFQETFWGITSPYAKKKSYQHSLFSDVIPKDLS